MIITPYERDAVRRIKEHYDAGKIFLSRMYGLDDIRDHKVHLLSYNPADIFEVIRLFDRQEGMGRRRHVEKYLMMPDRVELRVHKNFLVRGNEVNLKVTEHLSLEMNAAFLDYFKRELFSEDIDDLYVGKMRWLPFDPSHELYVSGDILKNIREIEWNGLQEDTSSVQLKRRAGGDDTLK